MKASKKSDRIGTKVRSEMQKAMDDFFNKRGIKTGGGWKKNGGLKYEKKI